MPAVKLCKEIGYENCGTIEFLVDDDRQLLLHGDEHAYPGGASASPKRFMAAT